MLKIPPNTSIILENIINNKNEEFVKKIIFKRLIKHITIGLALSFLLGYCFYLLIPQSLQNPNLFFTFSPIYLFIGLITAHKSIQCFNTEKEITDMAFKVIDKSISDIANETDTSTSQYIIDFTLLETAIFDNEQVFINDKKTTNSYHELRSNILKKYSPTKSPNIPFRSDEYKYYMNLLEHTFRNSNYSYIPFRETISMHFMKKDQN